MHPRTGIAVQRLAGLLEIREQIPEAEQLYRRSLTIDEKTFGENHPRVAISLANLAGLMTRAGRAGEAVALAQRSLQIDQKTYGKEHPEYVSGQKQCAWILEEAGRVNEAAKLQRKILERDRELLGEDHPEVGMDALAFGCLRLEQGHPEEAEESANLALRIFAAHTRRIRGEYPSTQTARALLRDALLAKGVSQKEIDARLHQSDIPSPQRVRARIAPARHT
jgi:tetratricopeptide (TPR) repeat protein